MLHKSLITYLTAGYPTLREHYKYLSLLAEYSDVIELGVPFSDPMADGKTIEMASRKVLKHRFNINQVFEIIRKFKREHDIPLILMSYYNPIYRRGLKDFIEEAKTVGVDGMLVVDLPPEYAGDYVSFAREEGIKTVFLVSLNTPHKRISKIDDITTGFIYLVSRYGTTGAKNDLHPMLITMIKKLKSTCKNKIAVGFGVSKGEQAQKIIKAGSDGVVVGSILLDIIEEEKSYKKLQEKLEELRRGIKS